MTRQSELLRAALAATPSDVRRLVARADDAGEVAPALARLVETERRASTAIASAIAPGQRARHDRRRDADGGRPASVEALAACFAAEREATLALLDQLPVGGWGRAVAHPDHGEIRVHALVRRLVEHDTAALARATGPTTTTAAPVQGGSR